MDRLTTENYWRYELCKIRKSLRRVLFSDSIKSEFLCGITLVCLGNYLFFSDQIFSYLPYRGMGQLAEEWQWGGVLILLGGVQILSVMRSCRRSRRISALLAALVWFYFMTTFISHDPFGLVWVLSAIHAVNAAWIYVHINWFEEMIRGNLHRTD